MNADANSQPTKAPLAGVFALFVFAGMAAKLSQPLAVGFMLASMLLAALWWRDTFINRL